MPPQTSVTEFLNVDLDIRGRNGLEEVLALIDSSVIVLHRSEHEASVELNESFASLEQTARGFVHLVEGLSPEARAIWNGFETRNLNVGIQSGTNPHAAIFQLSSETVAALANTKLGLVLTVYACAN
jgi:hypothetical protein